ncbi:MAG: BrnA antitoxin family protein [Bryobacteraceae bacterium]
MKREYDFSKAKRGPVIPVTKGKTTLAIQLDEEVVEWFRGEVEKAGGGDYQDLMNDALRQYMIRASEPRASEPLEETLRRVVREEIRRAG